MSTKAIFKNFHAAKKTAIAAAIASASLSSFAAITCTDPTASSANFAYVAGTNNSSAGQSGLNNIVQSNVSFSCTRTLLTDTTVRFGVDNGAPGGGQRAVNASAPAFSIGYNVYKNATCTDLLNDNSNPGRLEFNLTAAVNVAQQINAVFFTCIKNAQALTSYPAGLYTDTAMMFVRPVGGLVTKNSLQININAPALCSINGLPATNTIPLIYTAFQNTAAFNFASFNADCTNLLPYTMAVNPTSGVVGGLNYQLGLSSGLTSGSATNIGITPLNDIGGSSGRKVHYINAVMQAGQAGQVGAPLSSAHTLTITY